MSVANHCDYCRRRTDRPAGPFCENEEHPKPDCAQKIVALIEEDLSDRGGLGGEWDMIDEKTRTEIRDTWADIIRRSQ